MNSYQVNVYSIVCEVHGCVVAIVMAIYMGLEQSVNDDDDQLHVIADESYTRFMTSSVAEEASSNTHQFVNNVRVSTYLSFFLYLSPVSIFLRKILS